MSFDTEIFGNLLPIKRKNIQKYMVIIFIKEEMKYNP